MRTISSLLTLSIAATLGCLGVARADVLACYEAGNAAMKAGDFAAAAEAYARARQSADCAAARDGLLFNEAVALDQLAAQLDTSTDDQPLCRALYAYRRALPVARDATRPTIDAALARLAPACPPAGSLSVVCVPAGGTVVLDGVHGARACPALFDDLRPKAYRGEVMAAGRTASFEVEIRPGQRLTHRVELETPENPSLVSKPEPEPEPAGRSRGLMPYGWVAVGLGAVSAGVATYAYIQGGDIASELDTKTRDYQQRLSSPGADAQVVYDAYLDEVTPLRDEHQSLQTLHLATVIGAGVLIAGGAALIYFDEDVSVRPVVGPVSGVEVRWGP